MYMDQHCKVGLTFVGRLAHLGEGLLGALREPLDDVHGEAGLLVVQEGVAKRFQKTKRAGGRKKLGVLAKL